MANTANSTKIFIQTAGITDIKEIPDSLSFTEELPFLMEVPEMGVAAEKIDITTLGDKVKQSITGMKDMGELVFKFLYEKDDNYSILRELETAATHKAKFAAFQIKYPDNSTHTFIAAPTVKMDSATINGALTFSATMTLSTDIKVV